MAGILQYRQIVPTNVHHGSLVGVDSHKSRVIVAIEIQEGTDISSDVLVPMWASVYAESVWKEW